jgi:CRP-like cAMP-binding protein
MANHPDKETLKSFLSKVSLFGKADDSILSQLADKTEIITFENNQTIIQKGDIGETMYLIFSGRLKVHDGEHKVAELEKGGFFGELSLLDSEPRSMSVTALEKSVLGSINRNNFYEVLNKFPSVTKDIISALNKRLRNQNDVLISEFKSREAQLTELVKIRTNELEQKNQQLELTLDKLKRSQEQLVQSEK